MIIACPLNAKRRRRISHCDTHDRHLKLFDRPERNVWLHPISYSTGGFGSIMDSIRFFFLFRYRTQYITHETKSKRIHDYKSVWSRCTRATCPGAMTAVSDLSTRGTYPASSTRDNPRHQFDRGAPMSRAGVKAIFRVSLRHGSPALSKAARSFCAFCFLVVYLTSRNRTRPVVVRLRTHRNKPFVCRRLLDTGESWKYSRWPSRASGRMPPAFTITFVLTFDFQTDTFLCPPSDSTVH